MYFLHVFTYPYIYFAHLTLALSMAFKKNKVTKSTKGPSKTFSSKKVSQTAAKQDMFSDDSSDTCDSSDTDSSSSSGSSTSEVDVKFELFNMAESDYHSIKQYLGNLFGAGDHGVDLVGLTAFIVEDLADHLGTCVKTDGESSDPFGFITGTSVSFIKAKAPAAFESLIKYVKSKCTGREFDAEKFVSEPDNVVLFQERLINVPSSIAPPLYRQFIDDWEMAANSVQDPASKFFAKTPKQVLLLTPTYKEIVSKLDRELGLLEDAAKFDVVASGTNFYYEETEGLVGLSLNHFDFSVNTGHETSDSRRAFSDAGIEPGRRAFILSWDKLVEFVSKLETEQTDLEL
jgi:protein BCP1